MRKPQNLYSIRIVSVLIALPFLISFARAQSPGSDQAITALSVLGVVTEMKPDTREVVVTTAAGSRVNVLISDTTVFMRIPPGEKTKDKFIKITSADFGVGDSVFARGRISEDRKILPAREFYVMSKGEISDKRDREREAWRTRGIAGTVNAVNADTKEITVDARTAEGPKPIVLAVSDKTKYRRYAPNSVRFSDARSGSFADIKAGDQVRALGSKNSDGTRFTSEEIVSGSFQTLTGAITEINADRNEIKINEIKSHQPVTIVVSKDSVLKKLTPELLAALTPAKPGTAPATNPAAPASPTQSKPGGDLQEMFDQLPVFTLQDLKVGDSILVSSTRTEDATRATAIAVVSGVGPLLQNSQGGQKAVSLGAMSLGGP